MMTRKLLEKSQDTWVEILKDIESLEENSLSHVTSVPFAGLSIQFTDTDKAATSTVVGVQDQIENFHNDIGLVYVWSKTIGQLELKKHVLYTEVIEME